MKKSKNIRKILALAFALMLVFALASCGAVETERGGEIKVKCEAMVDALISNDVDAAYALFVQEMDKEEFAATFPSICEYIDGVETFELTQIGWYTGMVNGVSYYVATFRMTANVGIFTIEATEVDGYEGLYNFHIVDDAEYENYTGTLTKMNGASPLQWGLIIFSALCLGFVIWMLVDCIKRKMKYKPLWIILILCGAFVLTFTLDQSNMNFNANVAIMLFTYSYLQVYAAGASILKLSLPVGALVYLIFRKKFTLVPVQYGEAPEVPEEPVAGAQEIAEPETIEVDEAEETKENSEE